MAATRSVLPLIGRSGLRLEGHASLLIHKEGCKQFVLPKTNTEFWQAKIEQNRTRDTRIYDELMLAGWQVIVIWQCKLTKQELGPTMQQVAVTLNHNLLKILK